MTTWSTHRVRYSDVGTDEPRPGTEPHNCAGGAGSLSRCLATSQTTTTDTVCESQLMLAVLFSLLDVCLDDRSRSKGPGQTTASGTECESRERRTGLVVCRNRRARMWRLWWPTTPQRKV